jgi:hypothetical protein
MVLKVLPENFLIHLSYPGIPSAYPRKKNSSRVTQMYYWYLGKKFPIHGYPGIPSGYPAKQKKTSRVTQMY